MQSLGSRERLKLASIRRPLAVAGASPTDGIAELATDTAVGHSPGVGALRGVAGRAVIPTTGQVAVLAGLPGDSPAVPPPWMVDHEPERHAVSVLDTVRPATAEIITAGQ